MRLRHKKNAENDVLIHPFVINTNNENNYVNTKQIFGNNNPIYIELGMGKGKFVTEMSLKYPGINFIGIEKSATIVLKAINNLRKYLFSKNQYPDFTKTDEIENYNDSELIKKFYNYTNIDSNSLISTFPNLRFMCDDIINLENFFNIQCIDKIFLNFSDPWPKKRHEARRLTHHRFLSIYEKLLKKSSLIEFKTDNIDLFNFSLNEIKNSNFSLLDFTYDLHHDEKLNKDNIMTEYEYKFSSKGNKICKLIAKTN